MVKRPSTGAFNEALGKVIRAERTKHGWSQEDLAEACDLHRSYVTELENGHRTPNLGTLLQIATGLGMKTSKLIAAGELRLAKGR